MFGEFRVGTFELIPSQTHVLLGDYFAIWTSSSPNKSAALLSLQLPLCRRPISQGREGVDRLKDPGWLHALPWLWLPPATAVDDDTRSRNLGCICMV